MDRGDQWLLNSEPIWKDDVILLRPQPICWRPGELIAMSIPPTYEVEMLRQGDVDMEALKALIIKFGDQLRPYIKPPAKRN